MTLNHLRYVVETARCGSINRAAQALFVSQSAISLAIQKIEEEFDICLFTRNNQGVITTPEGNEFIRHAESILLQTQQLRNIMNHTTSAPSYRLRISSQRFPFATEAFLRYLDSIPKNARYQFALKETGMYTVINDVYDQQCDIGIIYLSDLTEAYIQRVLHQKAIEFHPLVDIFPHIYLRRAHPLLEKQPITVQDLAAYPYVSFDQDSDVSMDYAEDVRLLGFQCSDRVISVHERATAINILANTDAFSTGSGLLITRLGDERVTAIPIADQSNHMRPGWIKRKSATMTEEMERYVHYLEVSALE